MSADDALTVDLGGVIDVSANSQSVRFNAATDGATITNDGTIQNTADGGRAIRFESSVGAVLNATINNTGTVHSDDDAIQIQSNGVTSGTLTLTNDGTISTKIGQALDFAGGTGAFIADITNTNSIFSEEDDGIRIGGVGHITNSGTVQGGEGAELFAKVDGITFEDGASGTIDNNDHGKVVGDRHGINAGAGSTITVINAVDATLLGQNGSGVGSDGTATVTNHGTITGMFTAGVDLYGPDGEVPDGIDDGDGDGIDIDQKATIINFGTIQGLGANGNGSDGKPNTSEAIAAGGGSITNHTGAVISGLGNGILIDDSSQGNAFFITEIVNDGTITGQDLIGIKIVSDFDDTVTNSGTITGGNGMAIVFGTGDNMLAMVGKHATIDGSVTGGTGTDTLDYSKFKGAVTVDLGAEKATATDGVIGFENVIGSTAGDKLTGSDAVNVIDGGKGNDTLNGGGGKDTITGGDGNDVSDGGKGADTYNGGNGNDTYVFDNAGDKIIGESAKGGTDTIMSSITASLAVYRYVERLQLTGKADIDATGNTLANRLTGNKGDNDITGGRGIDKLEGNGGNDVFHFAEFGTKNEDTIADFDKTDKIALDHSAFTGLAKQAGHLSASDFVEGTGAKVAHEPAVIYNSQSGVLSYDHDGKGGDAAEAIAVIGKHLAFFDFNDVLLF